MNLFVANKPPKKKNPRRQTSKPKPRKPAAHKHKSPPVHKESTVSKKKNSRRATSAPKPRKTGKSKSSGGGLGRMARGFINIPILMQGSVAAAGMIGLGVAVPLVNKMLPDSITQYTGTPTGQIVIKTATALALYALAKKFAPKYATALGIGCIASCAIDVYAVMKPANAPGVPGNLAGYLGPGNPVGYLNGNGGRQFYDISNPNYANAA